MRRTAWNRQDLARQSAPQGRQKVARQVRAGCPAEDLLSRVGTTKGSYSFALVSRTIRLLTLSLLLIVATVPALAQGCAMCYSNAAGTTGDGQRAISRAVLVLLAPPVGFMTIGIGLAFQYGKKRDRDADEEPPAEEEHPI